MITGALTGFVVWVGLIVACRALVVSQGKTAPQVTPTGVVIASGFAAAGALIGNAL